MAKLKHTRDQYTVTLEGLRSDFKVFGEGLGAVREKVDQIESKVTSLTETMSRMEPAVTSLTEKMSRMESKVDRLVTDMTTVKSELRMIRHELKEKVGREEFQVLEKRVETLEKSAVPR